MSLHEIIDKLIGLKTDGNPTVMTPVQREVLEGVLSSRNHAQGLTNEVRKVNAEIYSSGDSWVVFAQQPQAPSRIFTIEPQSKNIICHQINGPFSDGLNALGRG